jgi:hypothetical protein
MRGTERGVLPRVGDLAYAVAYMREAGPSALVHSLHVALRHALELPDVVGDQRDAQTNAVRRYQGVSALPALSPGFLSIACPPSVLLTFLCR